MVYSTVLSFRLAKWRELLFRSPSLGDYVSGAILFEETLYQNAADGTPFVDVLKSQGVIPGIKVDTGLKPLVGGVEGETWCSGLDGLYDKCVVSTRRALYKQHVCLFKRRTELVQSTDICVFASSTMPRALVSPSGGPPCALT